MKKKKLGTLMIIIGCLVLVFALLNNFMAFFNNIDYISLISVGIVFLCCGTFIKNKKAL